MIIELHVLLALVMILYQAELFESNFSVNCFTHAPEQRSIINSKR